MTNRLITQRLPSLNDPEGSSRRREGASDRIGNEPVHSYPALEREREKYEVGFSSRNWGEGEGSRPSPVFGLYRGYEGESWPNRKPISRRISRSGGGGVTRRSGGTSRSRTPRTRSFEKSKIEIEVPRAVLHPGGSMGPPKRWMARNCSPLNVLRD